MAWDFPYIRRIHISVTPLQTIRTILYKVWRVYSISISKRLMLKVMEVLYDRIKRGILEEVYRAYRNPWFLVKKKDGGLRLINNAQHINAVTIRDTMIPLETDEVF